MNNPKFEEGDLVYLTNNLGAFDARTPDILADVGIGTVKKVDYNSTRMPFEVQFLDQTYWFSENAVRRVSAAFQERYKDNKAVQENSTRDPFVAVPEVEYIENDSTSGTATNGSSVETEWTGSIGITTYEYEDTEFVGTAINKIEFNGLIPIYHEDFDDMLQDLFAAADLDVSQKVKSDESEREENEDEETGPTEYKGMVSRRSALQ